MFLCRTFLQCNHSSLTQLNCTEVHMDECLVLWLWQVWLCTHCLIPKDQHPHACKSSWKDSPWWLLIWHFQKADSLWILLLRITLMWYKCTLHIALKYWHFNRSPLELNSVPKIWVDPPCFHLVFAHTSPASSKRWGQMWSGFRRKTDTEFIFCELSRAHKLWVAMGLFLSWNMEKKSPEEGKSLNTKPSPPCTIPKILFFASCIFLFLVQFKHCHQCFLMDSP